MIKSTDSRIRFRNLVDHFLARFAFNRTGHRIDPGLYALGKPDANSPVLVTANYTLSFDAVRSALKGRNAYILVLDTKGINVWCAAGKGSFGTKELVHRIGETGLVEVVGHRKLILPQLGAPGVAAHTVLQQSGFRVEYGPVRASDLPEYLDSGQATLSMRRVRFVLRDRIQLIPVEFISMFLPSVLLTIIFYFLAGPLVALAVLSAFAAGTMIFPLLLPWLPTANFSTKGFALGGLVSIVFVLLQFLLVPAAEVLPVILDSMALLLIIPAITAFLTLNFTGSSTFTSRTGVRKEIYRYIPRMAYMFAGGTLLLLMVIILN